MEAQCRAGDTAGDARCARGRSHKNQIHVAREGRFEGLFGWIFVGLVIVQLRVGNGLQISGLQHGMVSLANVEFSV